MKEIHIDLLPLISKLETVLKRGFTRERMSGAYQSVFRGKGMEFVGFREYVYNDDALLIDWKASLKAHKLMVRQLEEERNLTIFFLLDVSDSMLFSSHQKLKCEYAAELVGTLLFAMHQVGDNVGLGFFNDTLIHLIPPALGRNHFYHIVKSLSNPSLYGGKFDLQKALYYTLSLPFLRKQSVIFLVSDFIGMKPGWEEGIKLMGLKFDFTAIIVRDPVDNRLPNVSGEVHFQDPYTHQELLVNPSDIQHQYQVAAREPIERLRKELIKTQSSVFEIETTEEFTGKILKFFHMRRRFKR